MTNRQRVVAEASVLLLAVGGVLWAQAPRGNANTKATDPVPDVIRAREFQMVDKDGKVLAAMRINPAVGGPVVEASEFHVVNEKGYIRAAMRLDGSEGGPDVTFWSKDAKEIVAQLSLNDGDRPLLTLANQSSEAQLTIMPTDNGPVVNLSGAGGTQLQILMMTPKFGPSQIFLNGKQLVPAGVP